MAAYLAHAGATVEWMTDCAAATQWVIGKPSRLCVVVIDTVSAPSLLDDLRAVARTKAGTDVRFVTIGRGKCRHYRRETPDQVSLDAEVMRRKAFLEAVAVAAGRVREQDLSGLPSGGGTMPVPLLPKKRVAVAG